MAVTLFTWCWILYGAVSIGQVLYHALHCFSKNLKKDIMLIVLLGMLGLTVYAEFFSLFYKVGLVANGLLLVACVISSSIYRKEIVSTIKTVRITGIIYAGLFVICLVILVAARSSMYINAGDTYLYHAQAIHWISEYGVVKGLGNLHTRFAFNSAFLCLQALFSFSFLPGGTSYHTVNGFLMVVFLSYAVLTMKFWKDSKVHVSDVMKIAMIMYCAKNADQFSAPGTDLFALCLAIYILCEWISLAEDGVKDVSSYAVLCIFIVFDISLKLSTAMLLLLVLYPAVLLIRQKQWGQIAGYLLAGTLAIAPFLARNVIISGWLVYPFSALDIFNVDWKIPAETLKAECVRTLLGSREVYGVLSTDASISQWLPYWLAASGKSVLVYLMADAASAVILLSFGIARLRRKKDVSILLVTLVLVASVLYWWVSAPSIRYGKPFLLLLPLMCAGCITSKISIPHAQRALPCILTALCTVYLSYIATCSDIMTEYLVHPADYHDWQGVENDLDGHLIYSPGYHDFISYYYFPETNDAAVLQKIELRGDSLEDGFRTKDGVVYLF